MNRLTRLLVLGSFVTMLGCSRYPEVTSPEAQEFIQQIYTACNTRDVERLKICEEKLATLVDAKQVGQAEQKEFQRIIDMARRGNGKNPSKLA